MSPRARHAKQPTRFRVESEQQQQRVPRPPDDDQGVDQDQDPAQPSSKGILRLTSTNYETWTSHCKDFLYAIDAMVLFEKSFMIDGEEQQGKCSDDEVPLKARRAAWAAIARSLDSETYARIMPELDKGDVEELFRRVRVVFYPTHVSSVNHFTSS